MNQKTVAWKPQEGPQLEAILATWCEELFFGGARGGGKSDFLLGDYAQDIANFGEHWKGILFRKSYKELEDLVARSKTLYLPLGGVWKKAEFTWIFPNGATLKLRHLEREEDVEKYQGHAYTWIGFDELPNWANDGAYLKMRACLRNGAIPIDVKRIRSTGNPGGIGHGWVKSRFILPSPSGYFPIDEVFFVKGGVVSREYFEGSAKQVTTRMFIPSKIQDNKILLENDPFYMSRLALTGSEALVKAWLNGDWDAIEGSYFDKFDKAKNVVEPFQIPRGWYKIRAYDYGYAAPFSVGWYTVSDGREIDGYFYPKGALIKYREYYGSTGKADEGVRMENVEVAKKILELENGETIHDSVADPAIFAHNGGVSIAEQFRLNGVRFRRADNERLAGWQQIRHRIVGQDGRPLLYLFKTCINTITQLSIIQHDKSRPEDLDTKMEDHALDETRYACMSNPLTIKHVEPIIRENNVIYVDEQVKIFKNQLKSGNVTRL